MAVPDGEDLNSFYVRVGREGVLALLDGEAEAEPEGEAEYEFDPERPPF